KLELAPAGGLQGGVAIERGGAAHARVRVRAGGAVGPGLPLGVGDVGVALVEPALGVLREDVRFEQQGRTPIGQKRTDGRLDLSYRPDRREIAPEAGRRSAKLGHAPTGLDPGAS